MKVTVEQYNVIAGMVILLVGFLIYQLDNPINWVLSVLMGIFTFSQLKVQE